MIKYKFIKGILFIMMLFAFFDCKQHEKGTANKLVNYSDTLPNGKLLLDTYDSAMVLYYKEVVGTDTLEGGAITCYATDDSMRYFYLRKDDNLYLLNQCSKYVSAWSLGILEKDHSEFFITRIDNGNSSPVSYQVFDKSTGQNILGKDQKAFDYYEWGEAIYFLYQEPGVMNADSLSFKEIRMGSKKKIKTPENLPDPYGVVIDTMTKNYLIITYAGSMRDYAEKKVSYKR